MGLMYKAKFILKYRTEKSNSEAIPWWGGWIQTAKEKVGTLRMWSWQILNY